MNRLRRRFSLAPRALLVLLAVMFGSLATLQVGLATGLAPTDERPTPGQHIYDVTGLLTSDEIAMLEQHASAVEEAGAPCVVYLQAKDATQDETYQDAGDLMNRWDIESANGAQDGFVMFLNLIPGNLRHGKIQLFAGKKWYNSSLPQAETQRIYDDVMLSSLEDGDTAQAIADGLDAVAHDLRYGPPEPSAVQLAFRSFGRVPFNLLAGLYLVALLLFTLRARRSEPAHTVAPPLATPPSDLDPAIVGALLHGGVADAQMEGKVLDFARRGMLTFESASSSNVNIQVHAHSEKGATSGFSAYASTLWDGIQDATDADDMVFHDHMPQIRSNWGSAKAQLHADLIERGWLEAHADSRRTPLYGLGIVGIIAACVGFVIALIAQEGWAVLGSLALLFGAIAGIAYAHSLSELTAEGESVVGPWRGYASVLQTGYPQLSHEELDMALPYAVAMGYRDEIGRALEATGQDGNAYSPSWFHSSATQSSGGNRRMGLGFYPYWIGWHSAMYPPPSSSGSGSGGGFGGGFSGGGAAGGGGGGGGGF